MAAAARQSSLPRTGYALLIQRTSFCPKNRGTSKRIIVSLRSCSRLCVSHSHSSCIARITARASKVAGNRCPIAPQALTCREPLGGPEISHQHRARLDLRTKILQRRTKRRLVLLLVAGFQKGRIRPRLPGIVPFGSRHLSRPTVSFLRARRWRNVSAGRTFRRN